MNRVLLGISNGGEIKTDTVSSLLALLGHDIPDTELLTSLPVGGYKTFNLNKLVKLAQASDCSHLLHIDSDMIFPPDGLELLLKRKLNVVGANYSYRGNSANQDSPPSVVKLADNDGNYLDADVPDGLFGCAALGLGFTLFATSVFDKLTPPYFELDELRPAMEDVIICEKLRAAGYKIYCDSSLKLGHIGSYVY